MLRGRAQQTLYSDDEGTVNPYAKLKIKIEPTRLAVKVDPVEHVPTSPVSSQGAAMGGGDAFGTFRHGGNSSQGCSSQGCSQSQSPTESPMQSWRAGAAGPPAMAPLPPHMSTNGGYGGFNQGFGAAEQGYAGFDGSMGSMGLGGGFGGANGLGQQGQGGQGAGVHSSPMRGYGSYGQPQNTYGQTPQQPVF